MDRSWQAFNVKDIFYIFTGALLDKALFQNGKIPRITASDANNGVALFTKVTSDKNFRVFDNFISVSFLGSVFYQKNAASLDMKIHGMKPKEHELNTYTAKFLIPMIKKFAFKYRYGYQLSNSILRSQKIMLPIDALGRPDWVFMEGFIKQIEQDQLSIVLNYYKEKYDSENLCVGGVSDYLTNKSWLSFALEEVCEIQSGVRLTKQDMSKGSIPFIGASDTNNGITAFVNNQNASLDKNLLGVNYNGSVVESFYHPYMCLFSDDVKRLKIKHSGAGKYAYLFLKTLILKQKSKYQYGYKFNATRMAKQKILLPVTANRQPDWAVMEKYMHYRELDYIIKYLRYLQKR